MTESKQVLGPDDVRRVVTRMAHEIIERNHGLEGVHWSGLQRGGGGWPRHSAPRSPASSARYPWDRSTPACTATTSVCDRCRLPSVSDIPFGVDGSTVVLVDDVLYTGRTVKAAVDAITDYGRPAAVQLAVLVDRGHRELPIRPDFVGKNLPTSTSEQVTATVAGVAIG